MSKSLKSRAQENDTCNYELTHFHWPVKLFPLPARGVLDFQESFSVFVSHQSHQNGER